MGSQIFGQKVLIPIRVLLCAAVGVQLSVATWFGRRGERGFKVECVLVSSEGPTPAEHEKVLEHEKVSG